MRRAWMALISIAVLASCASESNPSLGQGDSSAPVTASGNPAPDFKIERLSDSGKFVSKKDFEGKVVLLEFWATWCGPCHELAPAIQKIYDKYKDKGFEVVSVSDEERAALDEFAKTRKQTYPIYQDFLGNAKHAYNIEVYPTFFLLDRKGDLILKDPENLKAVDEAIQKAL